MSHDTNDVGESDTFDRTTDADEGPARVRHNWEGSGQPSVTLVQAVAAATGRTITDLPPLQRSIDSDALDALLTRDTSTPVEVSFSYAGVSVVADSTGTFEVYLD